MENYSVLMSVYYKEKPEYLRQSIQSMLDQTVPTNDFVLVCDGPLTTELDAVIDEFNSSYPRLFQIARLPTNMGLGPALNEGLKYCKNDLVARMDSDDISVLDRCEKQLAVFSSGKFDIVSGTVQEFETSTNKPICLKRLPEENEQIIKYAKRRCPFNHPCVMYRKSVVQKAGGYRSFYLFEDYDLWVRMIMQGSISKNIFTMLLYMRSGNEMYSRRGGLKYINSMTKFRFYLYRIHFSSLYDFILSTFVQIIVCLLPSKLRSLFYSNYLRVGK